MPPCRPCSQGQKRLTNVAVVRLKKAGKRFEIACYKNKVLNWRQGVETDIDDVLQTTEVFQNVSKGLVAQTEDLQAAFGTTDRLVICKEILSSGDLQVSEKERKVGLSALFKDVASIIVSKCINPENNRPYTIGLIERALKEAHFAVDPKKSAKQQALEAVPLLQKHLPIQRAMMRLDISVPEAAREDLQNHLAAGAAQVEEADLLGAVFRLTCLIQPGDFRSVYNFVSQQTGGAGRLEVLSVAAQDVAAPVASAAAPAAGPSSGGAAAGRLPGGFEDAAGAAAPLAGPRTGPATSSAGMSRGGYALGAGAVVTPASRQPAAAQTGEVVYERGSIAGIPDQWHNRREMFKEIDDLQGGWTVELRARAQGSTVDAVFHDPQGNTVGSFAAARRQALSASKASQA